MLEESTSAVQSVLPSLNRSVMKFFSQQSTGLASSAPSKGKHLQTNTTSGKQIYSECIGHQNLKDDAPDITPDNVFSIASCTKLITSICALQCIERGLTTLDEPVSKYLPELDQLDIIGGTASALTFSKPSKKVTLRQLLTHSSGLGYDALHPLIIAWRESRGEKINELLNKLPIPEGANNPLVYEPGQGWEYGVSLDWAGLLIARLNKTTLEEYMKENIFKPLGMTSTSFYLESNPDMKKRWVSVCNRTPDGRLAELPGTIYPTPPVVEFGGHGLYSTPADFIKVLADIISDSPKLLKLETIENLMYKPQFPGNSASLKGLEDGRAIVSGMTAKLSASAINHGLGGLLCMNDDNMKNTLTWGGLANWVWFTNRERGFAALYSSHMLPPAEPDSSKLEGAFIDEMFNRFG
ncbi:beta-lactamase/transpeptidase-like protein [Rhizodiscina lignyota]|uniref:Beta-lactamase/transpeptidase-like protein n=1 Tax=Rhizodiscina lignyota TaxID=1504668 RepID=A0A9P4IHB6_9PEZI|nr:beta-lactamase/transpeptidase-like protein [Rhizodiscina lignyota]